MPIEWDEEGNAKFVEGSGRGPGRPRGSGKYDAAQNALTGPLSPQQDQSVDLLASFTDQQLASIPTELLGILNLQHAIDTHVVTPLASDLLRKHGYDPKAVEADISLYTPLVHSVIDDLAQALDEQHLAGGHTVTNSVSEETWKSMLDSLTRLLGGE